MSLYMIPQGRELFENCKITTRVILVFYSLIERSWFPGSGGKY